MPGTSSIKRDTLRVGGLVPLSTTDYPDQLSAVVFCQGCAWRCSYCHNPHLLPMRGDSQIEWDEILAFLDRRRGLLDAVVFSGGEPTLQRSLPDAMRTVRAMGHKVGLHTAGIHPRRLAAVLPLTDWVGMDIKAEFHRYSAITAVPRSGERAQESMELILASGVAHEFRTTVHPTLFSSEALERLADALARVGVRHYVLQESRGKGCARALEPRRIELGAALHQKLAPKFTNFSIRRA